MANNSFILGRRILKEDSSSTFQMKLMKSEETLRSDLMYRQLAAFEEKVEMCFDRFDVTLFYSMVRQLSQQSSVYDINSVCQLRQVYDDEISRSSGSAVPHNRLNKCLQYFKWFCKFLTYLRDLWISFNSRIFVPLFKYFLTDFANNGDRRGSTSSSLSKHSFVSFGSSESGIMSDIGDVDKGDDADDVIDDAEAMARLRTQSHTALMLLTKEFKEIKTLYDTSDTKKIAQKLSFLKDQLEFNMEEDESIDHDLLSEESARAVEHLDADEEINPLLRYVPDILFKFKTAAILARKWLQLDDRRSRDFSSKLRKIVKLEDQMTERLSNLVCDIKEHERTLERDTEELQNLLSREERSSELSMTVHHLDERIKNVNETIKHLRKEKIIITNKLVNAVKKRLKTEYKQQKIRYESNRLQRYSSERQLATLQFRRDLVEADMHIEIGVKPHLIRSTNDLQDKVENLEQILEEEKREEMTLKSALIPVQMDRKYLTETLQPGILPPINKGAKPKALAEYVGSRHVSPGKANHVKTYRNASKLPVLIRRPSQQDAAVQVSNL